MIQIKQLIHLHIPGKGYQDPTWSPELCLPSEYLGYLSRPSTRVFEEYDLQLYIPNGQIIALSHVWPSQDSSIWGKRWAMNSHTLFIREKDYCKIKSYPAALEQCFEKNPVDVESIEIDESTVTEPQLSEEQVKWLVETFTQEELKDIIALLYSVNSDHSITITIPPSIKPLDLIHILLKIAPYPCRQINYITSRNALKPPLVDYNLRVYEDKTLSVKTEYQRSKLLEPLIEDTLQNLNNLQNLHNIYSETYEELATKMNPKEAQYYANLDYVLKTEEQLKWLAQQYLNRQLYSRSINILKRLEVIKSQ